MLVLTIMVNLNPEQDIVLTVHRVELLGHGLAALQCPVNTDSGECGQAGLHEKLDGLDGLDLMGHKPRVHRLAVEPDPVVREEVLCVPGRETVVEDVQRAEVWELAEDVGYVLSSHVSNILLTRQ